MKRILALALALIMALSLAACGGGGDKTPSGDNTQSSQQQEQNTPDPGTPQTDNQGGESSHPGDDASFSTDWYTKPFHIKGMTYDGAEPDEELEILYDGQALIIWQGEDGRYAYFDNGKLMDMVVSRKDGDVYKITQAESNCSTMLEYMENKADYINSMIYYLNELSNYVNKGSETINGIDCDQYESAEEDMLGNIYHFWIDKATGVLVKEQTDQHLFDPPEVLIAYVVDSISVTNVPSISSLYEISN